MNGNAACQQSGDGKKKNLCFESELFACRASCVSVQRQRLFWWVLLSNESSHSQVAVMKQVSPKLRRKRVLSWWMTIWRLQCARS